MRTSPTLLIGAIALAASIASYAQTTPRPRPSGVTPVPEAVPPPPEIKADPSLEPEVTIVQRDGAKIEEYRVKGKLFAMKVTPAGGIPYYLVDNQGNGDFVRMESLDGGLRVPMWLILTF